MNTPQIDPSTKKAFNFPKSADGKDEAKADAKSGKMAQSKAQPKPASESKTKASAPAVKDKSAKKAVAAKKNAAAKKAATTTESKAAAPKVPKAKAAAKTKPATKQAAKPATKPAADATAQAAAKTDAKAKRVKKEKVVRDSFTMPKSDYARLASLKQKCLTNGVRVKKSELLRAALTMLDAASDKSLIAAIEALEAVKTGRPSNA